MHRLGYILYVAAGLEFAREDHTSAALVAVGLLGWSIAADLLAWRTTWAGPVFDESGYGTGVAQADADYLSQLDRFAAVAGFLAVGLGLFGPLLFVWSLLF